MKGSLIICLGALCLTGCSGINKMEATRQAIDKGLVEGLSATNHDFIATVWSFPGKRLGPYYKLGGLEAIVTNSPGVAHTYVFYMGKSRETGHWELFSSMKYDHGKWEPVQVRLPQATKQQ